MREWRVIIFNFISKLHYTLSSLEGGFGKYFFEKKN